MSATEKPVWIWLPGEHKPLQCGTFALREGVGSFSYAADYRERPDAIALDPVNLPFTRAQRPVRETRQGGLFGVFRDASPEGFGLTLLEQLRATTLSDPMQRLELSEGDAVGAVQVCDDIEAKLAFKAPDSAELLAVIDALPEGRPSSQAAREVRGLHGTSLGGERPKLTVLHKGQLWIAKLQDRGDPAHAPLREFVAMRLAAACGLRTAEVEFERRGEREVLLVRRFDRNVDAAGATFKSPYASAHTVLRLDAQARGERQRSYVALSHEIRRWCGRDDADITGMQRELWRRMAFNAVIGNGDDHPRNHGLVHREGRWDLAEAFDIAPYITFSGTLAMAMTRRGESAATQANLLADCTNFGYEKEEARAFVDRALDVVASKWPQELESCGYAPDTLPAPSFNWLERSP